MAEKLTLGEIKDDDEFEDFEETEWEESKQDVQDESLWLEDWEQDQNDEFTMQLRAELQTEKK
jgi:DSS1/SEM1 family